MAGNVEENFYPNGGEEGNAENAFMASGEAIVQTNPGLDRLRGQEAEWDATIRVFRDTIDKYEKELYGLNSVPVPVAIPREVAAAGAGENVPMREPPLIPIPAELTTEEADRLRAASAAAAAAGDHKETNKSISSPKEAYINMILYNYIRIMDTAKDAIAELELNIIDDPYINDVRNALIEKYNSIFEQGNVSMTTYIDQLINMHSTKYYKDPSDNQLIVFNLIKALGQLEGGPKWQYVYANTGAPAPPPTTVSIDFEAAKRLPVATVKYQDAAELPTVPDRPWIIAGAGQSVSGIWEGIIGSIGNLSNITTLPAPTPGISPTAAFNPINLYAAIAPPYQPIYCGDNDFYPSPPEGEEAGGAAAAARPSSILNWESYRPEHIFYTKYEIVRSYIDLYHDILGLAETYADHIINTIGTTAAVPVEIRNFVAEKCRKYKSRILTPSKEVSQTECKKCTEELLDEYIQGLTSAGFTWLAPTRGDAYVSMERIDDIPTYVDPPGVAAQLLTTFAAHSVRRFYVESANSNIGQRLADGGMGNTSMKAGVWDAGSGYGEGAVDALRDSSFNGMPVPPINIFGIYTVEVNPTNTAIRITNRLTGGCVVIKPKRSLRLSVNVLLATINEALVRGDEDTTVNPFELGTELTLHGIAFDDAKPMIISLKTWTDYMQVILASYTKEIPDNKLLFIASDSLCESAARMMGLGHTLKAQLNLVSYYSYDTNSRALTVEELQRKDVAYQIALGESTRDIGGGMNALTAYITNWFGVRIQGFNDIAAITPDPIQYCISTLFSKKLTEARDGPLPVAGEAPPPVPVPGSWMARAKELFERVRVPRGNTPDYIAGVSRFPSSFSAVLNILTKASEFSTELQDLYTTFSGIISSINKLHSRSSVSDFITVYTAVKQQIVNTFNNLSTDELRVITAYTILYYIMRNTTRPDLFHAMFLNVKEDLFKGYLTGPAVADVFPPADIGKSTFSVPYFKDLPQYTTLRDITDLEALFRIVLPYAPAIYHDAEGTDLIRNELDNRPPVRTIVSDPATTTTMIGSSVDATDALRALPLDDPSIADPGRRTAHARAKQASEAVSNILSEKRASAEYQISLIKDKAEETLETVNTAKADLEIEVAEVVRYPGKVSDFRKLGNQYTILNTWIEELVKKQQPSGPESLIETEKRVSAAMQIAKNITKKSSEINDLIVNIRVKIAAARERDITKLTLKKYRDLAIEAEKKAQKNPTNRGKLEEAHSDASHALTKADEILAPFGGAIPPVLNAFRTRITDAITAITNLGRANLREAPVGRKVSVANQKQAALTRIRGDRPKSAWEQEEAKKVEKQTTAKRERLAAEAARAEQAAQEARAETFKTKAGKTARAKAAAKYEKPTPLKKEARPGINVYRQQVLRAAEKIGRSRAGFNVLIKQSRKKTPTAAAMAGAGGGEGGFGAGGGGFGAGGGGFGGFGGGAAAGARRGGARATRRHRKQRRTRRFRALPNRVQTRRRK